MFFYISFFFSVLSCLFFLFVNIVCVCFFFLVFFNPSLPPPSLLPKHQTSLGLGRGGGGRERGRVGEEVTTSPHPTSATAWASSMLLFSVLAVRSIALKWQHKLASPIFVFWCSSCHAQPPRDRELLFCQLLSNVSHAADAIAFGPAASFVLVASPRIRRRPSAT